MFFLIGTSNTYILNKNGVHTIGRLSGDIIIKDSSVSRKHAQIKIENNKGYLSDCNSKYFTRYNGKTLLVNEVTEIVNGCDITFGEVTFKVQIEPQIVTCATGLKDREGELSSVIKELGGVFLKDWDDTCTHLTTTEIMITLKVIHAIMDNRSMVTPQYWKHYLSNIRNYKLPPDPKMYFPPLGENIINSKYIEYNANRESVFVDKIFVFWKKKTLLRMEGIIKKAGGRCMLLEKKIDSDSVLKLIDKHIVLEPEDINLEQVFSNFLSIYKSGGRRLIPTQEIVLAILQCSCEENCNPIFDRAEVLFSKDTQKTGPSKAVIPETQSQCFNLESQNRESVIPETCDMDFTKTRVLNVSQNEPETYSTRKNKTVDTFNQIPTKKIKLDSALRRDDIRNTQTEKRPREDNAFVNPFSKKVKKEEASSSLNPFLIKLKDKPPFSNIKTEPNTSLSKNPFALPKFNSLKPIKDENKEDDANATGSNVKQAKQRWKIQSEVTQVSNKSKSTSKVKKNGKQKVFSESSSIDFSNIQHDISEGMWLERKSKPPSISPKVELDEEERKWCEKFNNSVVIVVKNLIKREMENGELSLTADGSCDSVRNFKKFRKVPVLKSGTMVKCTKKVFGRSNLGINYGFSEDEDDGEIF